MNTFLDPYQLCGAIVGLLFAMALTAWTLRQYLRTPRRIRLPAAPVRIVIVRPLPVSPAPAPKVGRRAA
jgi:hypothetical protein